MGYNVIVVLALLCFVGVLAGSNDKKMDCIHKKYQDSLGASYTTCYNRSGALPVPRMKQCYQDVMKAENVVRVASDGQMTVNRNKFGEYATANNNPVKQAMKACYDNAREDDRMYQEAARASQCVFDRMKQTC